MTLILSIIAAPGWIVASWLYLSRREERRWHTKQAIVWFWQRVEYDERIKELRELVNRERRNTGKAEI